MTTDSGSHTAGSQGRRRVRRVLFAIIFVLYVGSVPWYRSDDAPLSIWLGLPDWVATALLCYVAIAILNALAWILADVPERLEDPGAGQERT